MNKKTLSLTLTSAIASTLLSIAPSIQAGENPFAMSSINTSQQLAADENTTEAASGDKMKEAKCGADKKKMTEGKCGADKKKMTEGKCGADKKKMTEGKCGADKKKMTEGKCGADKMKGMEGAGSPKAGEAKCGANKTETAAPAETGTTGQ
jgi:uncharacterized low-complexity protein